MKAQEVSLKGALLKFENDLKAGAPKEIILKDLKEIENLKRNYPVYHLPEVNYLTGKEVEKVPLSDVGLLKKVYLFASPFENALKATLIFLAFYLLLFYVQGANLKLNLKRYLSLLITVSLLLSAVFNLNSLLFFLGGLVVSFSFSVGRRYLSVFILGALLFLSVLIFLKENISYLLASPSYLYSLKVERDGYSPEYLISKAIPSQLSKEIETITSSFALGDFSGFKKLKEVEPNSSYLKAVVYNDLGYFYFYKGDYNRALSEFKKALIYYSSPAIQFNLYLAYSSLLEFDKANVIKKQLLKDNPDILKALPVPLLLHVKVRDFKISLPYLLIFSLITGVVLGSFVSSRVSFKAFLEESFLRFPGMVKFINSDYRPFVVLFLLCLFANFLIGKLIWGM
ncbi:tetratricopeptide repeat protein [Thermovibrio sp.]